MFTLTIGIVHAKISGLRAKRSFHAHRNCLLFDKLPVGSVTQPLCCPHSRKKNHAFQKTKNLGPIESVNI
jgi:hypothetical protein